MRAQITAVTHRGLVRDHNEDCLGWDGWALNGETTKPVSVVLDVVEPIVVVVCDGMGGHAGGETASRLATTLLTGPAEFSHTEDAVRILLQRTSDLINQTAEQQPHLGGMGCTVVGLVLQPDADALVFNVGDSRCYRVEGRYLAQLSTDHKHPDSGALTQALGGGRRLVLTPDFFTCPLPADPGLILSTDGLDNYTSFSDVEARALRAGHGLVTDLRDLALAGGGGDNVTVVQVALVDEGESRG
jgi:PPM family protein phosphatase